MHAREGVREAGRSSDGLVVGRDAQLAVVASFLVSTVARPAALVIEGEAGIGKTTIVRAALEQASAAGLRLFLARPAAGELELPYAGLGDLLATIRPEVLGNLARPQRAAVEAALAREGSPATADGYALSRGLLELLRLEGSDGDLLIVVDDVQWLDRRTAAALTFAFRRLGAVPVRVLVARRTESGSPGDLPLGLGDWEDSSRVEVGRLAATALGELLRRRLGVQLPRPRLEALEEASAGNPMFAIELVREGYDGRGGKPPTSLSAVLAERFRGLDGAAQSALGCTAAMLRPSTTVLLRAGVDREQLRSALDTDLITLERERITFSHPLLAAVAYDRLLPEERREIHARLAAAATDPLERGHHLARSAVGPDEAAAIALGEAAETAAELGDHAGAAVFLLAAAELTGDSGAAAGDRSRVRAAREHLLAGDIGAAEALCRSAVGRLPAGSLRASARHTLVYCTSGAAMSYGDCIDELALALEDAESDEPLQAELHVAAAELSLGICSLDEAVRHSALARELAGRVGASGTAVTALAMLGFAESMLGLGVTDAAREAVERWDGTIGWSGTPRIHLACAYIPAGRFDEAGELFEQEIAMAQEHGVEWLEVIARGHLAEAQMRAGRWSEALANARVAVEHARQATEPQVVTGTSYALAMTEALLGRLDAARAIATESLTIARLNDDFWFIVSHQAVLGLVALTDEDAQGAIAAVEPAWGLMLERGLGDLSLFPVPQVLGEALIAVGRHDEAVAIAERLHAAPVGAQPWCRGIAYRLDALVASTRGEHAGARAAIAAALEVQHGFPEPFEHARSLHIQGRIERSARGWSAARAAFTAALEQFDQLGAARWAEKAAADLGRLPGRRPADRRELTAREREVGELVAAGLANKEIAARLFVSVSTVEATLSKAYVKLGVRSRTELANRLNTLG
jgi:DNA-binding CsgD family transcriptional regulator/tetratricopeptide (TPR) repeat protein